MEERRVRELRPLPNSGTSESEDGKSLTPFALVYSHSHRVGVFTPQFTTALALRPSSTSLSNPHTKPHGESNTLTTLYHG
jgi:hypothetical protein